MMCRHKMCGFVWGGGGGGAHVCVVDRGGGGGGGVMDGWVGVYYILDMPFTVRTESSGLREAPVVPVSFIINP